MPKTRRAGRKNQLRRLICEFKCGVSTTNLGYYATRRLIESQGKTKSNPVPTQHRSNGNQSQGIQHPPWKLHPVTIAPKSPPKEIPEGDPRFKVHSQSVERVPNSTCRFCECSKNIIKVYYVYSKNI